MGNLFAHVIGFTNIDGKGQEGLELSREDSLRGEDGAKSRIARQQRQHRRQPRLSAQQRA